jgi:AcrR family transcriptional regulator
MSAISPAAVRRRTPSTKLEQRAASMELLLAAALRLFVSQGYHSTNLEGIASAARLTKGAVYFYFRSKEAVLLELLRQVRQIVVEHGIAAAQHDGATATDRLVAYLHQQAQLGVTHRDEVLLLILMSLEFKERESEAQNVLAEIYKRQTSFLEALVRSGQKSGEFRTDVPARELASIILAAHDGTFLQWHRRSASLKGSDVVRALRGIVLSGLLAPAPAPAVRAAPAARKTPRARKTA